MILLQLLTFLLLSSVAIVFGKYLFWALFMKDAPSLDEQDAHLLHLSRK